MTSYSRVFKYVNPTFGNYSEFRMHVYVGLDGKRWYRVEDFYNILGYLESPEFIETTDWKEIAPEKTVYRLCIPPYIDDANVNLMLEHSTVPYLGEFQEWFRNDDESTHIKQSNLNFVKYGTMTYEDELREREEIDLFNAKYTSPV